MALNWHRQHASIPDAFRAESCFTLDYARDRMLHVLGQLSDEQIWWRPQPRMNAVGNIVLHVCGNLTQWVIANLRGQPDRRDRPAEFAQRNVIPGPVLADRLRDTVEHAKAAITAASDAELLRTRFVQIAEVTGVGAVYHSVAHLEGHAQELIYIARLQLGNMYRFKDQY